MSDEEEKVDGELNPDLLEAGLEDEPVLDGDIAEDDDSGIISLNKAADDEDDEAAPSDSYDDEDNW